MGNVTRKELDEETQLICGYLEKMEMFRDEKHSAIVKIASGLKLCYFTEGDVLLRQGEEASSLFIVADGFVSFSALDPTTGNQVHLGKLGRGETFGEFGLVYDVRRTAGAVAMSKEVVVLRLDRKIYEKIKNSKYMKKLSERVRHVCAVLMKDGLQRLPFLQQVDPETLDELAHLFKFEVVKAGKTICKEGEVADRFYIVYQGELVVTMKDELGFHCEISRLGEGQKFGDLALLNGVRRTASVTTLTGCELFSLGAEDFQEFLNTVPAKVRENMLAGSYTELLKKSAPIFNSLSLKNQQLLGVVSEYQPYFQNEVIIKEGTIDNQDIYVLFEGEVHVTQGGKFIRSMKSGYFGELSLFTEHPNSSTVRAVSPIVRCLRIPLNSFKSIMATETAIYAEIALRVMKKQATLEHILRHPQARDSFLKYCQKEFAQENVDFWIAVTKLEDLKHKKTMPSVLLALHQDPKEVEARKIAIMRSICQRIYKNFIEPGSPNEVNIAFTVRSNLVERYEKEDFDYYMFGAAKLEVFKLVEADNFSRYKNSEEFAQLLDDIGQYLDGTV